MISSFQQWLAQWFPANAPAAGSSVGIVTSRGYEPPTIVTDQAPESPYYWDGVGTPSYWDIATATENDWNPTIAGPVTDPSDVITATQADDTAYGPGTFAPIAATPPPSGGVTPAMWLTIISICLTIYLIIKKHYEKP
jgi:hypothetical protein